MSESELCDCGARLRRVTINAEPAGSVCEECGMAMPDAVRFVPTNPPSVPSLDVEACVRLLNEDADRLDRRIRVRNEYSSIVDGYTPVQRKRLDALIADMRAEAELRRALASALPGMGKGWKAYFDPSRVDELTVEQAQKLHRALAHYGYCPAARAAQPEETSADG